ncbi:MAG TPA: YceI family protein [Pseudonocardiaceae bacterium]|jgi:polyisoprenoid-binding protein YceI|nr:YceI family protein [Pseudonocardiaceae bacterium]
MTPGNDSATLAAGHGVTVRARTTDGWPVATAVLTVTDATGQQVARAGADADGQLATEPLPSGTYTAIITSPGFGPVARTAMVTASGSAPLGAVALTRVGGGAELPEAGTWTIDPAHSAILITARHMGIASVRGRFAEFGGQLEVGRPAESSTVTAKIQAASIDTGNKMRDDHLRSADFLHVDQYPVIEYQGTGIVPVGGENWRLQGDLVLNGVTQPVAMELTFLGVGADPWGGTRASFHAVTDLKQGDFAITFNQTLAGGITMIGTTLRVEIDIEAVQGDTLPMG